MPADESDAIERADTTSADCTDGEHRNETIATTRRRNEHRPRTSHRQQTPTARNARQARQENA